MWHHFHAKYQQVPTQENTPIFRNQCSSLGPILSSKVGYVRVVWTPSFLDMDPNFKLVLRSHLHSSLS